MRSLSRDKGCEAQGERKSFQAEPRGFVQEGLPRTGGQSWARGEVDVCTDALLRLPYGFLSEIESRESG